MRCISHTYAHIHSILSILSFFLLVCACVCVSLFICLSVCIYLSLCFCFVFPSLLFSSIFPLSPFLTSSPSSLSLCDYSSRQQHVTASYHSKAHTMCRRYFSYFAFHICDVFPHKRTPSLLLFVSFFLSIYVRIRVCLSQFVCPFLFALFSLPLSCFYFFFPLFSFSPPLLFSFLTSALVSLSLSLQECIASCTVQRLCNSSAELSARRRYYFAPFL